MAKINFKTISQRATKAAGLTVGVVGSRYLAKTLNGVGGGKIKPAANALIRVGVGAMLPSLFGSKKSGMIEDVSNGMMAEAATSLASAMGVPGLAGTDTSDSISDIGYSSNEDWILSGTDTSESLSGMDDDEN